MGRVAVWKLSNKLSDFLLAKFQCILVIFSPPCQVYGTSFIRKYAEMVKLYIFTYAIIMYLNSYLFGVFVNLEFCMF